MVLGRTIDNSSFKKIANNYYLIESLSDEEMERPIWEKYPNSREYFVGMYDRADAPNRLGTTLNVSRAVTFIEETLDRIDTRPAEDVNLPEDDARERVMREIVKRQGQQEFRQRLLEAYQGRCAITDSSTVEVLEAAHIRPFNGPETNKLPNGLLLRSDLHTLFDMGFITISPEMKVSVSDSLPAEYRNFDGKDLALPPRTQDRPSKLLLDKHRTWHLSRGHVRSTVNQQIVSQTRV